MRKAAADDWTMFEDDATEELRHAVCVSNLAYCVAKQLGLYEDPVSYTHLTLPTIYSV